MTDKTPNLREAAILAILRTDNKYGTQIRGEYNEFMQPALTPGALYVTLGRMEESKLVTFLKKVPTLGGGNDHKYYAITPEGEASLALFIKITSEINLRSRRQR